MDSFVKFAGFVYAPPPIPLGPRAYSGSRSCGSSRSSAYVPCFALRRRREVLCCARFGVAESEKVGRDASSVWRESLERTAPGSR